MGMIVDLGARVRRFGEAVHDEAEVRIFVEEKVLRALFMGAFGPLSGRLLHLRVGEQLAEQRRERFPPCAWIFFLGEELARRCNEAAERRTGLGSHDNLLTGWNPQG